MKTVKQALKSSISHSFDYNQSKYPPILDALQNNSLLISEAKILGIDTTNNKTNQTNHHTQSLTLNLGIKRQIGCNQSNCCSSIFKYFLDDQSNISLRLNPSQSQQFLKENIKENQWIQIGIKKASYLNLVIGFYLLPLISFLFAIFMVNLLTSSPIILFLSGIGSSMVSLIALKKIIPFNLENHIRIIYFSKKNEHTQRMCKQTDLLIAK